MCEYGALPLVCASVFFGGGCFLFWGSGGCDDRPVVDVTSGIAFSISLHA